MLTDREIKILLGNIKQFNCQDSFKKLREAVVGLEYSMFSYYSGVLSRFGYSNNNFEDDKECILTDAIISYDETKGSKFTSWLSENTKYFCLNKINELNREKLVYDEPETITNLMDSKPMNRKIDNSSIVEFSDRILGQLSDKRIKKIFSYRYSNLQKKMTWKQISEKMKISPQTCINLHQRGLSFLKQKILSKETFDKL